MATRGTRSLRPAEGLAVLGRLLEGDRAQMGVIPLDIRQWVEFYPRMASSRRLSRLLADAAAGPARPAGDQALLARLAAAATPAERVALVQEAVGAQVCRVLRIPESQLDPAAPLSSLGMDSLMSLEIRNRIEATLGITVPATLLWTYPTVAALAAHLGADADADAGAPAPREASPPSAAELAARVEDMSADEALRMIAAEFENLS